MQYLKQITMIMVFSFFGEVCRMMIPLPIPASIYGMVLLFAGLYLKIIRLPQVRDAGSFLTSVLPVLFVAPAVNLVDCWDQLRESLLPLVVIVLVSTFLTFGAAGLVTKWIMKGEKGRA